MTFMLLTLSQTNLGFFENTVGKGEIARNEQFFLFPQCFLPSWRILCPCHPFEIAVCKLFQFGTLEESKICRLGKS